MQSVTCSLSIALKFHSRTSVKIRLSSFRFLNSYNNMTNRAEPETVAAVQNKWKNITKSLEDKRHYRGLEFSNQLRILLISDSSTEKSAAALDVNVGSLSDPDELPGLAHFCEHMLFLGTEKYPEENEYNKYLSSHGGSTNACTDTDHTKYYFDVLPEYFEGALDRFAQFFLSPLFTESATSREVKAVNSEHEKNVASDTWRLHQFEKFLSKKGHPYGKFATGNIKTLQEIPASRGIDVRKELLSFHSSWYSANTMSLVVLGKESLDELEAMVARHFGEVLNKNVEPPEWLEHPMGPEQMRMHALVVPVKDTRNMTMSFPVPDMHEHYKSAPLSYIAHLVGHEGQGSLLSALKERGWCNSLYAGDRVPAKGFATFGVTVDLTIEGLDHVNEIVTLVFQYLNRVRIDGPHEWMFEEVKQLNKVGFRFKDKENPMRYVSGLATHLRQYPLDEVLVGPFLTNEWRPDLIKQMLELLVPSRVSVAAVSKSFEPVCNMEEPWYGTKYKIDTIADSLIQEWENCGVIEELQLPKPNIFIPTNFDILPLEENRTKNPTVVFNSDISRIWFKQDEMFLTPKLYAKFEIFSPIAHMDPLNACLTFLFSQLIKDDLNEFSYDASLAGLNWNIANTRYGFSFAVDGYNDKLNVLLEKIVDKITNFTAKEDRFEIIKEIYTRTLRNFESKQPYEQSTFYLDGLLSETSWTRAELLDATPRVTPQALRQFTPALLSSLHVEGLIHGNVNKAGAVLMATLVEDKLKSKGQLLPLKPRQMLRGREVQLEDGSHYVYEARNSVHKSSCTTTYFQCGLQNTQSNTLLELLWKITSEPCFNELRTKEQLGYLVWSQPRRAAGVQGLNFTVQSEKHPEYLTLRVEAFLVHLRGLIESMPEEEFESHKEALAAIKLEKSKKLKEEMMRFWQEIGSRQYHFDRKEVEVPYLRTITKEQLLEFFDTFIASSAPRRHRLSVHVISDAEGGAGEAENTTDWTLQTPEDCIQPPVIPLASKIEDVTSFKSSHSLFPLVQPYMEIPGLTKSKL